jgi:hypothetical protein
MQEIEFQGFKFQNVSGPPLENLHPLYYQIRSDPPLTMQKPTYFFALWISDLRSIHMEDNLILP